MLAVSAAGNRDPRRTISLDSRRTTLGSPGDRQLARWLIPPASALACEARLRAVSRAPPWIPADPRTALRAMNGKARGPSAEPVPAAVTRHRTKPAAGIGRRAAATKRRRDRLGCLISSRSEVSALGRLLPAFDVDQAPPQ